MVTLKDILNKFEALSFSQKEKGTQFERLMQSWLKTDPRYANLFSEVWLWEEFPGRKDFGGKDTGIDIVAKTDLGDYWAIQCKCYSRKAIIDKPAVDSFLATSSRTFTDETTYQTTTFSQRLWIATTNHWGANAEEAIHNQNPPVSRVSLSDLEMSPVDWEKLLEGLQGKQALTAGKQLRKHQLQAISAAEKHFKANDRGKLVMACGTGKTFTSLRLIEHLVPQKGLVLFMVPSIALLGQSLNDWSADAANPIKAICICSDNKASRKVKRNSDTDDTEESVVDLALPASTNVKSIVRQLHSYKNYDGLVVVFSTYQSIDVISEAQKELLKQTDNHFGEFDFIVCDEAHRTTGVKLSSKDESNFTKIHSNEIVAGKKRLYMTATPRLYGESAKIKASKNDCILCSMDDKAIYGEEFFRVNFSYAVQNGILTDYKVLVLTVSENMIPANILAEIRDKNAKELNYDDTGRLIGIINGLSKKILGDKGLTWSSDPRIMKRALAFTHKIGSVQEPGTSKNVASILPRLSSLYEENLNEEEKKQIVHIQAKHVDGSMSAAERNEALSWLAEDAEDPQECRIITNVRCLSEGVDVPALDAVLFLSARNSQVDVVQSVGRVMRSFHKGLSDEKKYGYIIIPVVVPENTKPEDALNDNVSFSVVWDILNALRSHDDHFNAHVNTIALNKDKGTKVTVGLPGFGQSGIGQKSGSGDSNDSNDATQISNQQVATQLQFQFGDLQQGIFAKLVEKCGDRLYWENWAGEVGLIARKYIERISRLVHEEKGKYKSEFEEFVKTLQQNLNPGITPEQCIEMLAQHLITRPVFEALFSDYEFVANNSISKSMQFMIELLETEAVDKDLDALQSFYKSVRANVGKIDNLEGKQTIIKNLYEKFFKRAFPLTVEKLGTVYTPVECVDFIIRSVDDVLKAEFGTALSNENVHILDPFTGTGTFITRLLQIGVIKKEDLVRKYTKEIHCNEIVLLAYYIADVNIESVFQEQAKPDKYLPFNGICLTDTFQLGEQNDGDIFKHFFKENSEAVEEQKRTPVRVIIGNPPYSAGQKTADDNAQNQHYEKLETKIANSYVAKSNAGLTKGCYDSYIKAFRWSTDRLDEKEGGVIAFISNGSYIDSNALDGFRYSLAKDFDKIYVFNLRGNQRTSGELSRKEGGKIFGSGSRTPIAITILVKYPKERATDKCEIYYHDIGDYLDRDKKLQIIKDFRSYKNITWEQIQPNEKFDWINQRDGLFDTLIPLVPAKKFNLKAQSAFSINSCGVATARDSWVYNFSQVALTDNIKSAISFYNSEVERYLQAQKNNPNIVVTDFIKYDPTKFSWDRAQKEKDLPNGTKYSFNEDNQYFVSYRPFCKQGCYFCRELNNCVYQIPKLYPTNSTENLVICFSSAKTPTALITNIVPDYHLIGDTQCFPLFWYQENKQSNVRTLFDEINNERWTKRDGITDWFLKEVRSRFNGAKNITKEDIFYYVYGLLHSNDYRNRFADDLRKSLPRIPIVENANDFIAFSKAGRQLAELHLNYENYPAPQEVIVNGLKPLTGTEEDYSYFAVEKMRFPKKGERNTIILNSHITIENIPAAAYEYIVNGKSAIEWIMERYAVTIDKKSGIKNDPNLWAKEHNNPRYILDLLLSIIHVSIATQEIVNNLPKLQF